MTDCNPTSDFSTSNFQLGSGFWTKVPTDRTADIVCHHLRRAWQAIADYQLLVPVIRDRLDLTVKLAVEAGFLFFNAAIFE